VIPLGVEGIGGVQGYFFQDAVFDQAPQEVALGQRSRKCVFDPQFEDERQQLRVRENVFRRLREFLSELIYKDSFAWVGFLHGYFGIYTKVAQMKISLCGHQFKHSKISSLDVFSLKSTISAYVEIGLVSEIHGHFSLFMVFSAHAERGDSSETD